MADQGALPPPPAEVTALARRLGGRDHPRRRQAIATVTSLLVHALLLSLAFGDGAGLPGLELPWRERRAEASDLQVVLAPSASPTRPAPPQVEAATPPVSPPVKTDTPAPQADTTPPNGAGITAASPEAPRLGALQAMPPAPPPAAVVITALRPERARWAVDAASAVPAAVPAPPAPSPDVAASAVQRRLELERALLAQEADERAAVARQEQARQEQVRLEAQRLEDARQAAMRAEAQRQEAARLAAELQESQRQAEIRQEAARVEAARLDAERAEAARLAAAKQEAARAEAARLDAQRQQALKDEAARAEAQRREAARAEAARQEAARGEAARAEAERQDAARQAAAKLEASKQDAARQDAARLAAAKADEERREERLRAIGRQLDEEAARRDAAARQSPSNLPMSYASPRRGRLFGRTDTNTELVMYAEAMARKIQLNPVIDLVRELVKQPYTDPLVTIAVRSDGSVESITFVRSSGVSALDDAVRRIVQSQERYAAFPPALAREYDVVEIRRTWHFDNAVRLY